MVQPRRVLPLQRIMAFVPSPNFATKPGRQETMSMGLLNEQLAAACNTIVLGGTAAAVATTLTPFVYVTSAA